MDEMHTMMIDHVLTVGLNLRFNVPSKLTWKVIIDPGGRQRNEKIDTMTPVQCSTDETADFDLARWQPNQFKTSAFPAGTLPAEMAREFEKGYVCLAED